MEDQKLKQYKQYVRKRLEALRKIFAHAAIGDFSSDVPSYDEEDEFTEFYVGIQVILSVVRKTTEEYERLTQELNQRIQEQEETQKAMLNVLEDVREALHNVDVERAKYATLVRNIGEGVMSVDRDGKVTIMNKKAEDLTAKTSAQCVGRAVTKALSLFTHDGHAVVNHDHPLMKAMKNRETIFAGSAEEPLFLKHDSHTVPVMITAAPLPSEAADGAVMIMRDVTKDFELSKTRSEFINLASHQLKSPMVVIRWATEWLLEKEQLSDEGKNLGRDMMNATMRLTSMTDLLLNVSRLEEGLVEVLVRPVDFAKMIREYIAFSEKFANDKGITLKRPTHESLSITSDEALIQVVMQMLVTNALDYTPKGGTVTVTLEEKRESVVLEVRDTGIGIPKEEQKRIFERFMRGSNAKLMKADGNGLGLYSAKKIMDLLGGRLWFESKEGEGSTFFAEFPRESQARAGKKRLAIEGR